MVKFSSKALRSQKKTPARQGQQGQLVIEYVLLLSVVAVVGWLFMMAFIGRGGIGEGTQQGFIVRQWAAIVQVVSQDLPDN